MLDRPVNSHDDANTLWKQYLNITSKTDQSVLESWKRDTDAIVVLVGFNDRHAGYLIVTNP